MSPSLYLINDDQPGAFKRRVATIVRKIRVGNREGVLVMIQPPIPSITDEPLAAAIFVPRRRDVSIDDVLMAETQGSISVFVCQPKVALSDDHADLASDDVSILFWGRISTSTESLKFPPWRSELR